MSAFRKNQFYFGLKLSRAVFCVLGTSLFFSGCSNHEDWMQDDPEKVLSAFLISTESQDIESMWEFLSESSRTKLNQLADDFNRIPGSKARRGCDMIRPGHVLYSTREYKKIEVVSQDNLSAQVDIVMHDDLRKSIFMRRETKRWAIDLPSEQIGE